MFPLLRCLLMPSPSFLLAPLNFKSAFSLQRIFRCQIFPCEDWQFGLLVLAVLFAWAMAWDPPIVNIVLQTIKRQLSSWIPLVIDGNSKSLSVERCLETNMHRDVKPLYDVMADTIRYIHVKMRAASLQLGRTHTRFTRREEFSTLNSLSAFLIGRKRTVKFRNQRLGRHLAADYTIIMSRTLKATGNHVMHDRRAWFQRVIMSSSRALCRLPSVKKQKHDFLVCFVDRPRHRKSSLRQGVTNKKRSTKGGKGAVCWLREREETERTWGKERIGTNFENILCRSEKVRIRPMYN